MSIDSMISIWDSPLPCHNVKGAALADRPFRKSFKALSDHDPIRGPAPPQGGSSPDETAMSDNETLDHLLSDETGDSADNAKVT